MRKRNCSSPWKKSAKKCRFVVPIPTTRSSQLIHIAHSAGLVERRPPGASGADVWLFVFLTLFYELVLVLSGAFAWLAAKALVWEVSRLRVAAQKLAKVQKQLANKYEY